MIYQWLHLQSLPVRPGFMPGLGGKTRREYPGLQRVGGSGGPQSGCQCYRSSEPSPPSQLGDSDCDKLSDMVKYLPTWSSTLAPRKLPVSGPGAEGQVLRQPTYCLLWGSQGLEPRGLNKLPFTS